MPANIPESLEANVTSTLSVLMTAASMRGKNGAYVNRRLSSLPPAADCDSFNAESDKKPSM